MSSRPDALKCKALSCATLLLAACSGSSTLLAQFCFEPAPFTLVGVRPSSMTVGDWNEDGHPDLAVDSSIGSVSILLGNGHGDFSESGLIPTAEGPDLVLTGHFDIDGHADLVVIHNFDDGIPGQEAHVWSGTGTGTFVLTNLLTVGEGPHGGVAEDFDNDGIDDLIISCCGDDGFSFMFSQGVGLSMPLTITLEDFEDCPYRMVADDFDSDGHMDFAVTTGDELHVYRGMALLPFQATSLPLPSYGNHVNSADVNGDGHPDLFAAGTSGDQQIFLGNGSFSFTQVSQPPVSLWITDTGFSDFDGDGTLDMVSVGGVELQLRRGDGAGGFLPILSLRTGYFPIAVEVGDWSEDGNSDALVLNRISGDLAVHRGNGQGDFDSGTPAVAENWGYYDLAVADFNDDGMLDFMAAGGDHLYYNLWTAGSYPMGAIALQGYCFGLKTGDLNLDGNQDVVTGRVPLSQGQVSGIDVYLSDGVGGFTLRFSFDFPWSFVHDFVLADLNADGTLDIVAVNGLSLLRLLGDGLGGFVPLPIVPHVTFDHALACADFNGDGHLDLATTGSPALTILLGDGTGNLSFWNQVPTNAASNNMTMAAADFDGNGTTDVAISENYTVTYDGFLLLALADGFGNFTLTPRISVGYRTMLTATDIDQNGTIDLLFKGNADAMSIFGDGNGGFSAPVVRPTGGSGGTVLIDVNSDGTRDVVTLSSSFQIRVIHGVPCPKPFKRGDANTSGDFDLADVIVLLAYIRGATMVDCEAALDVNEDGDVNLVDAIAALAVQFLGADPPLSPFEVCGDDPTPSGLSCVNFPCP